MKLESTSAEVAFQPALQERDERHIDEAVLRDIGYHFPEDVQLRSEVRQSPWKLDEHTRLVGQKGVALALEHLQKAKLPQPTAAETRKVKR